MVSLSSYLSEVPDFRRQNKNYLHNLQDILLLSVCAIFHGADGYEEIADFGIEKKEFLQNFLRLPNGIPSHDTIRTLKIDKETTIFLCTDGYQDQFGGDKGKKIMKKTMKSIFVEIAELEEEKQKEKLENYFFDWKNKEEQVDDVLVMGFKVG